MMAGASTINWVPGEYSYTRCEMGLDYQRWYQKPCKSVHKPECEANARDTDIKIAASLRVVGDMCNDIVDSGKNNTLWGPQDAKEKKQAEDKQIISRGICFIP
ncbi:hypothetical protein Tco_1086300 [Tanacetum coccineum]